MDLEQIPSVILPIDGITGEYKLVQFSINDKPFLRFLESRRYHRDIVRRFALELDSELEKTTLGDSEIYVFPKDSPIQIVGAGKANLNFTTRQLVVYGMSEGYRIYPDRRHLDQIKPFIPDWTIII